MDKGSKLSLNWKLNREISKLNYRIHTDAIKENLIPPELTSYQFFLTYGSEADGNSVILISENPNYEPIQMNSDDLIINGKVIVVLKKQIK